MKINGNTYSNIAYYGGTPIVGNAYRVFVPFGNMSQAFTLIFADTSTGESGVQSVNGKTGDVVLTAADVGALPSGTKIPSKTSDLINDSGYITESDVPTKTSELINDSGYVDITDAKNAAPVQSVNSKTGTVVIGKTDVGLGDVDNVKQYSISNPPPYPVTSVNGQTGDVTISTGGNVDSVNGKTGVVVLTQDDIGDGITYVRTHNDFTDVLKTQINTNEDNIAILDGDVEGLQTDVSTLKTSVTSIQTALTSKQDVIVGAASTITEDNLATDRALVSNSSGKVVVSNVTSTELGYLDGVTSNVQTQLDKKLEKAPVTSVNSKIGNVVLTPNDIGINYKLTKNEDNSLNLVWSE